MVEQSHRVAKKSANCISTDTVETDKTGHPCLSPTQTHRQENTHLFSPGPVALQLALQPSWRSQSLRKRSLAGSPSPDGLRTVLRGGPARRFGGFRKTTSPWAGEGSLGSDGRSGARKGAECTRKARENLRGSLRLANDPFLSGLCEPVPRPNCSHRVGPGPCCSYGHTSGRGRAA